MAVDSLVDKTKLNNSLSYEADRIRLKTGGSADIAFDFANEKGFGDAIDAIPTGGGGSGIQLLNTITVPENSRAVNLDFSSYTTDLLIVSADVELTASDWLYFSQNGDPSNPTSGTYAPEANQTFQGLVYAYFAPFLGGRSTYIYVGINGNYASYTGGLVNLVVYTYSSSKYIKAGSTFKVYGGNYANLR